MATCCTTDATVISGDRARVFEAARPGGVPGEIVRSLRQPRVAFQGPIAAPVGFAAEGAKRFGNVLLVSDLRGVRPRGPDSAIRWTRAQAGWEAPGR